MAKIKLLSESALRKKYPLTQRASILIPDDDMVWLPSRILSLNWQLGGGIPYGRIVEIFGWESTGKSLLALDFAYATQALGGMVLWADLEGSWTNYWAEKNGIDCDNVELYEGQVIEEVGDWIRDMGLHYRKKLDKNEPILFVVDSIAAGDTDLNLDADMKGGKAEMGNRAKAWEGLYRKRNHFLKKYGIILILINQVRDKIGASMFESAETTPGGKGTKFYASQRIAIGKGKQILTSKKKKAGQNVYFQIKKNKVAPPKSTVHNQVHFIDDLQPYVGFNRYMGLLEIAVDEGVITKQGNRHFLGKKQIANGKDNTQAQIDNTPKLRRAIIKKLGINSISKTQEKIDSMGNLFNVKIKSGDDE